MVELDPNVDWNFISGLIEQIKSLYPSMAWALDVPELADVLIKAGLEQWDQGRVVAAIQNTEWWKQKNAAQREWEQLIHTDPAEAESRVRQLAAGITRWAASVGISLSRDESIYIARFAMAEGKPPEQWQAEIVDRFAPQQPKGPVPGDLRTLARQWAVPLSDQTVADWAARIMKGEATQDMFLSYLKEQAKSLFPGLSSAIDRGITPIQYANPYIEIAVQELGINPADFDLMDPRWSRALHNIDPRTGLPVSMSLAEWTKVLRTDPTYGYADTPKARDTATRLGQALLERLGRAA